MIRRLYDWTMSLAARKDAEKALFGVSFIESSIFPIPPDVMLIPMVIARRDQWLRIAAICTIASVLGALAGYAIGMFLYEQIALPVLTFYGKAELIDQFKGDYASYGGWAVLFAAVTPFPFKVLTITSGALALNLPVFIAASIIGRAFRFVLVSWLLYRFGEPIRVFIEKHLGILFTLFMVLLIGGFVSVRYLF
ncbi:MAG: DedA family protein [Phyllobacteriaceae bacterium]|nr:DedA family protein [Phyllobacteriaceae bacterium]